MTRPDDEEEREELGGKRLAVLAVLVFALALAAAYTLARALLRGAGV